MEELEGMSMTEVDFDDGAFAEFLKTQDRNWTWDTIREFNRFMAHGKLIALVKYKNDVPCARVIWVATELIVGTVHDSILFKKVQGVVHAEEDKARCIAYDYPCGREPQALIYEDHLGTYWLKSDLKEEAEVDCPKCDSQAYNIFGGGVYCTKRGCVNWKSL